MTKEQLKPLIDKAIFDVHNASVVAENMKVEKPGVASARELYRRTTLANASALALERALTAEEPPRTS